jgi:predicted Zn-dependent peptidase
MKKVSTFVFIIAFVIVSIGFGQVQKPDDLKFPPLKYDPPHPKDFRVKLSKGMIGYIQEDHSLPLVEVRAYIKYGSIYDPEQQLGIGDVLSGTLIKGGTRTKEGGDIEERIDFLGGSLSFYVSERTSSLSLFVLKKDLDEGLSLFFDVLKNPEFREESLRITKGRLIESLKQANDSPRRVLSREFNKLIYGDHPLTFQPTKATIEGVSREDLKALHSKYFFPANIMITAAGDFNTKSMMTKINTAIKSWKNKKVSFPEFSQDFPKVEPGVYFIQKKINQGYIQLGHLGLEDTHPDYYAVQVMNFILGGGSFTSRIVTKVRSDEGLAYSTGSRFGYRWGFPGTVYGFVQTKSATAGYAISLILKEFERIRKEIVSDEEMETAINYYIESFPNSFTNPMSTMSTFAMLEMRGRPMDYYQTYRDKIKAVTKEQILEVAQKYIHPDKMAIMIVGDWEPCNTGGDKFAGPLDNFGKVNRLTLKDPLTGEEIKQQ